MHRLACACSLLLFACSPSGTSPAADSTGSDSTGSSPSDDSTGPTPSDDSTGPTPSDDSTGLAPDDARAAARDLLERLGGLWSAPVQSWTSVGSFPRMAMDFRVVDERVLFGRVDLDADNALRFGFGLQEVDGADALVFRNGGLFAGLARDTLTVLVERSDDGSTWRFCAHDRGCDYVDATLTFAGPDGFELIALVHGQPHMRWQPSRLGEAMAAVPEPLHSSPADAPWPPMPTLTATLGWSTPTEQASHAWLLLANESCTLTTCPLSRFIRAEVPIGATSVELHLDQLHAGIYRATAVLDRNDDLATIGAPGPGDLVSIPNAMLTIDAGDNEANYLLAVEL